MNLKRTLGVLARIAISAGLLLFLYLRTPRFEFDELVPDAKSEAIWWTIAALVMMLLSHALVTRRWDEAARAIGIRARQWRLFSHYMAGVFVSNFVPTTVGGDVIRIRRLGKDTDDPPGAFASVVFERLSGWFVLPVFSLIGILFSSAVRGLGAPTRVALIVATVTLFGLAAVLVLAGSEWAGERLGRRKGMAAWFNGVHVGIDALRERPEAIIRILSAAFIYQVVLISVGWCALQAVGIEGVSVTAFLALYPAVLTLQVLPVGIGGLGVRESAFVLFLGALGVPDEQSVALGLLIYFVTLASTLIGLPMLVFGDRGTSQISDPTSHRETTGTIVGSNASG